MNMTVHIDNLGEIPSRTAANVLIPIAGLKNGQVLDGSELDIEYQCVDCGYKTQLLDRMKEHQRNQKKYHNWWIRFKRWWAVG